MNAQHHPDWCSPSACTAYGPMADEFHRSEPIVVKTDDPVLCLYVYKVADGGGEFVEMSLLEPLDGMPWHLCEPVCNREIVVPQKSVDAMRQAFVAFA